MVHVRFGMFLASVAAASSQQRTKIFSPSCIRCVQLRAVMARFLLHLGILRRNVERKNERPVLLGCLQIRVACVEHVHPGGHELEHNGRIVRAETKSHPFLGQCLADGCYEGQDCFAGQPRNHARIVRVQSFDQVAGKVVFRLPQPLDRLLAQFLTVPAHDGSDQAGTA
uniref:Putative secreted protein n=1 Tax=Anopheles marajoara TaxID=58244 RepID=A0A2M4C600_9DIPT